MFTFNLWWSAIKSMHSYYKHGKHCYSLENPLQGWEHPSILLQNLSHNFMHSESLHTLWNAGNKLFKRNFNFLFAKSAFSWSLLIAFFLKKTLILIIKIFLLLSFIQNCINFIIINLFIALKTKKFLALILLINSCIF